jgi:hypothetical protein
MIVAEFFLYADLNSDVLVHLKSRIRIEIYHLGCESFQPDGDKHHIYARCADLCLAFEASEYRYEHMDILTKAFLWYSRYQDVKLEIFLDDPRGDFPGQRYGQHYVTKNT